MEVARYVCSNCNGERPFPESRCGICGARSSVYVAGVDNVADGHAVLGDAIERKTLRRIATGIAGVDEALLGGFVLRRSVLLYGPPGSRKTTLAGAAAQAVSESSRRRYGLYITCEQDSMAARDAAERLGARMTRVAFFGLDRGSGHWSRARGEVERLQPIVVVYDSIQEFSGVRLDDVISWGKADARARGALAIFVSQVNGSGAPAGPRRTIHRCDVEAEMGPEGEWIRVHKGRDGHSTARVALSWPRMIRAGVKPAGRPSESDERSSRK